MASRLNIVCAPEFVSRMLAVQAFVRPPGQTLHYGRLHAPRAIRRVWSPAHIVCRLIKDEFKWTVIIIVHQGRATGKETTFKSK